LAGSEPRRSSRQVAALPSKTAYDETDFEPHSESSEADIDAFSPAEEVKPKTKKRPAKTATVVPKTKRRTNKVRAAPNPAAAGHPSTIGTLLRTKGISHVRLTPSTETLLLNKWLDALPGLKVITKVLPTKMEARTMLPLGNLPKMSDRDFRSKIELADVHVTWDPVPGEQVTPGRLSLPNQRVAFRKYERVIRTWRIHVWNNHLPSTPQKTFRLFPEFKSV
jgi:hypothetical protein